ncbi:MAG: PA2169 family four-helix-bundle protein [Acidimicrobiia bacterium]
MELSQTTTILEGLNETLEDGRQGFNQAAEKLEADGHGQIAAKMREFARQRAELSSELASIASANGMTFETRDGTAAGALHRGWMSLKDALTGSDPHAILAAAERGEDHAVEQYREALNKDLPAPIRDLVSQQATAVQAAHDQVRDLRDAHA